MRWFTSDTHFAKTGDKILRREMRPYKTIKEYCDDQYYTTFVVISQFTHKKKTIFLSLDGLFLHILL